MEVNNNPNDGESICQVKHLDVTLKRTSNPDGKVTSASLVLMRVLPKPLGIPVKLASLMNSVLRRIQEYQDRIVMAVEYIMVRVGFARFDALELPELPFAEVTLVGVMKHGAPFPFINIMRQDQHDIHGLILLPAYEKDENGTYHCTPSNRQSSLE